MLRAAGRDRAADLDAAAGEEPPNNASSATLAAAPDARTDTAPPRPI